MQQLDDQQVAADIAGYYAAALDFIDPQLTLDSPLGMIEAAAETQRMLLKKQHGIAAQRRMHELNEALDFVRRSYGRISRTAPDSLVAGGDGAQLSPSAVLPADAVSSHHSLGASHHGNGNGNGSAGSVNGSNGHANGNGNGAALENAPGVSEAEVPAGVSEPDSAEPVAVVATDRSPASPRRRGADRFALALARHERSLTGDEEPARKRSPLARLWESEESYEDNASLLPEQTAMPHLGGFALLLWQALLACSAGWTVPRLIVWPHPNLGWGVTVPQGAGLILLAGVTAATCGWLSWRYRQRTGHVAALAWATAAIAGLYLLAWWHAPKDDNIGALVHPPSVLVWTFFGVASLVAVTLAYLHDARHSVAPADDDASAQVQ